MKVVYNHKGDFSKTRKFLEKIYTFTGIGGLNKYGKQGVEALKLATPKDTEETANSWIYKIELNKNSTEIHFLNTNETSEGTPIVILLQYGHATNSGSFVKGVDFINPAIKPIFNKIVEEVFNEIKKQNRK